MMNGVLTFDNTKSVSVSYMTDLMTSFHKACMSSAQFLSMVIVAFRLLAMIKPHRAS